MQDDLIEITRLSRISGAPLIAETCTEMVALALCIYYSSNQVVPQEEGKIRCPGKPGPTLVLQADFADGYELQPPLARAGIIAG